MKTITTLALLAAVGSAAAVAAQQHAKQKGADNTIVAVATKAGSFNTLIAAFEATGLDDVLEGEGPFTVFAPTDEAFARLPAGTE
jgi:uncharacterized surface protein with fasciclin (FAS1) repeats